MSQIASNLPNAIMVLEPFVKHYGYFGVGGLLLLESTGIPIPGETTLIAAAVFAGFGQLNIIIVVLVGILACIIGDNIAYLIGSTGGRKLIEKYGKYIFLDQQQYRKVEVFFEKRGGLVVIVARFFEGLRQLNGFIAGSSSMSWPAFLTFNVIGSILWVGFWSIIGFFSGNHINTLLKYQAYLSIVLVALIVALGLRFLLNRRNRKNAQ
jgi:membrane protein DedA with SNARE-associated domain